MDSTIKSYIDGGEDAAYQTFNDMFGAEYGQDGLYFDGWMFGDMSGLLFNPDTGGE
jgi:hypothetical protein